MKLMWLVLSSNGRRQFPMAFMPPRKRCRPTFSCGCSSEPDESSSLDMDALQQRINRQNGQYSRLLVEQLKYSSEERKVPESVHIILFQPGTDQQHVHTIEMPIGSGNNLILAFESGADCVSFARDLQDLEFGQPHPGRLMNIIAPFPFRTKYSQPLVLPFDKRRLFLTHFDSTVR